jgi:hypothetical protein
MAIEIVKKKKNRRYFSKYIRSGVIKIRPHPTPGLVKSVQGEAKFPYLLLRANKPNKRIT